MGIIPRKLKKVNGFVKCKMGPLIFETDKDRIFLEKIGKIFDNAVKEGRIIMRPGRLPTWDGAKKKEMEAHQIIMAHYLKNFKETGKIIDERERLGYH
jgi:hypothetical protein